MMQFRHLGQSEDWSFSLEINFRKVYVFDTGGTYEVEVVNGRNAFGDEVLKHVGTFINYQQASQFAVQQAQAVM